MADFFPYEAYRTKEGLGVWEHRGKVAAVGIGHAPTWRRWDGLPETSIGALCIEAIRRALDDAGLKPEDVDGLTTCPDTTTGSWWPEDRPIPEDFLAAFNQTDNPLDGLACISPEWILKNMPELSNVTFMALGQADTSYVMNGAVQAVGDGKTKVCIVLKGWHNFAGRYYAGRHNALPTVSGPNKYGPMTWAGPTSYSTAQQFERYCRKYGKTHEMMAPFVVNSRHNGLLFPEGYWAQHRPEELTVDDYVNARWIAKPANLYDNDIPIHTAAAFVITTAERARDLKQKPVYVLGHAGSGDKVNGTMGGNKPRSVIHTLEEIEYLSASTGRRLCEAAGITPADIDFENLYDGFGLFHVFHIEGLGFAGIKQGEALDLFQEDISIHGPHPVSPSGGNIGGGRTRFWHHSDSIQQIQGRAGERQIRIPAEIGAAGGMTPTSSNFIIWSATPD